MYSKRQKGRQKVKEHFWVFLKIKLEKYIILTVIERAAGEKKVRIFGARPKKYANS